MTIKQLGLFQWVSASMLVLGMVTMSVTGQSQPSNTTVSPSTSNEPTISADASTGVYYCGAGDAQQEKTPSALQAEPTTTISESNSVADAASDKSTEESQANTEAPKKFSLKRWFKGDDQGKNQSKDAPSTKASEKPQRANPQKVEGQFVTFQPNFPLKPGSMNLFGYEFARYKNSKPILSPDKSTMAITDVHFMPAYHQTYSRVYLLPVGKTPKADDLLTTEQKERWEKEKEQAVQEKKPLPDRPMVTQSSVDPHQFWDRYQVGKQKANRQVIYEQGFDRVEAYRDDVVQVVDWSADGQRVLMVHRPSIHHLGIIKSLPIVYDAQRQTSTRFSILPKRIWQEAVERTPELAQQPAGVAVKPGEEEPLRVWDIRPLGWSVENPSDDIIVKLVVFERQSEIASGFWSYTITTGQLRFLGDMICPQQVARNGHTVQFVDPAAPGGSKTYDETTELPSAAEREKTQKDAKDVRKTLSQRLQFWKKWNSNNPHTPP